MKRLKLKKKIKIKISTKITFIIIIVIIGTSLFINYVNKKMLPSLMKYAIADTKKLALTVMENSVDENIIKILSEEEIFYISKNNDGEVSDIDFNPVVVNKVLNETTKVVNNNLKNLEKGDISNITYINKEDYNIKNLKNGVISELPIGIATNNSLLANIGPKIPVKLSMSGNVISNVYTKTKTYGINSIMVEVYAHIEVNEEVIIPFYSKEIKVQNNIPIAIKIIQGKVPEYYSGLNKESSTLSIPIDNN